MKLFLNNAIKKYKYMPIEMKAAAWYAIGNIIQKIAPWLVMIILTHYLTINEYGIYSTFMSWTEIFEIIVTLRIYSNGYIAGIVQEDSNRAAYTATMQSLSIVLIIIWTFIYLIFYKTINYYTGINVSLSITMISSFLGTISFGLWSSRQRVDNQYKKMLLAIIIYGLIGPIVGALTVFLNLNDPIFYIVVTRTVIQLVIAVPFFISNYKDSFILWKKSFAVEALKYNLPLVPYYLSMILLNQSDRLMIQKIDGYADAGLYSVSYSAAMIIFIISGALNLSLQSWLFKELKMRNCSKDKSKFITIGTIVVAFCAFIEIVLAPELIFVLGGKKYLEAIWVIPPLAISVIVMYIYQQYVNVLFFYKKTTYILIASFFSAVCNIILNVIFIPAYGFVAGGYTSLASYLLIMILYFVLAKKECSINEICMKTYFNTKLQMIILLTTSIVALFITAVYKNLIMRYIIVLSILIFIILAGKKGYFYWENRKSYDKSK